MTKPRLLDTFCGAGGCSMGYHRAGFDVVGVDIVHQKRYPFEFVQADAIEYIREHGREFDVIHASPPCQRFCDLKGMYNPKQHPDLLTPTRAALQVAGKPYVIENVPGAPMQNYITLCGTAFGMGYKRRGTMAASLVRGNADDLDGSAVCASAQAESNRRLWWTWT